jgi:hypothetical protein
MLLALLMVGFTVHATQLHIEYFYGSSGVATALLCALALRLTLTAGLSRARALAAAALVALMAKAATEQWTGCGGMRPYLPEGARALPAAHLAGGIAGALAALGASLVDMVRARA